MASARPPPQCRRRRLLFEGSPAYQKGLRGDIIAEGSPSRRGDEGLDQ